MLSSLKQRKFWPPGYRTTISALTLQLATALWGPDASAAELVASVSDREVPTSPALRVATIGYRLVTANVAKCTKHAMTSGFLLHDLAAYDRRIRLTVAKQHGFDRGFGIIGVVPDSPAQHASLRTEDEIVAMDGIDLRQFRLDLIGKSASYARTEAFVALLSDHLQRQPVHLYVNRQGTVVDATIVQQPGCAAQFTTIRSGGADAWSDGRYVAITDSLARLMDDDELAFVIAHELAHVVMGHADAPRRPLAALGIGAGRIRKEENEADRAAVRMMATAGYDTSGAARAFGKLVSTGNMSAGPTHPAAKIRIKEVELEARLIAGGG
ncbi:peptidase M48 family protein [Novosphingobium sp. Rr 2-17]|nr:peptidase M48 family protein [Novosphingobium sp. Rr 2-17]